MFVSRNARPFYSMPSTVPRYDVSYCIILPTILYHVPYHACFSIPYNIMHAIPHYIISYHASYLSSLVKPKKIHKHWCNCQKNYERKRVKRVRKRNGRGTCGQKWLPVVPSHHSRLHHSIPYHLWYRIRHSAWCCFQSYLISTTYLGRTKTW